MKRRDFNRIVLGIGLSLILANVQVAAAIAIEERSGRRTDDGSAKIR